LKKLAIAFVIIAALIVGAWYGTFSLRQAKAEKYLDNGNKYFAEGNDREAIIEYKKGAFLYPAADIYFALGQVYFLNQNLSRAETYFKNALAKDANHSKAAFGLSETYLFQEKYSEAEELIAGKSLGNDLISIQLSRIYLAQEKDEKAEKSLEGKNGNLEKFYQAKILLYQGQFSDAEERTMLILPPDQSKIKVIDDAIDQTQKTSNSDSRKVIFGEALNQTYDAPLALPILKKVAESNATYRDACVFLGHSYLLIKQYETAKDTLLKAKELDPIYYPTWLYLSKAYKGLGDAELANTCYEKAEKLQ
jgi:tetratricopeptide (TPR) repeat protein